MKYALLFAVLIGCSALFGQQIPDTTFHYTIFKPAFRSHHPVVFIDEAHGNFHTADNRFRPLGLLLESDGFIVKASTTPISSLQVLAGCDIFVISNPLHPDNTDWIAPIKSAFTDEEIAILNEWVNKGGRLLLIGDHMPFAGAISHLAASFGFEYLNGFEGITPGAWPPNKFQVKQIQSSDPTVYKTFLRVDSVATFTGSAIKLPDIATNLLAFNANDSIHFTDTAWVFPNPHRVQSLTGYSQGGILRYGKGKVAAFGEAAMFTAQLAGPSRYKVGFNADVAKGNCPFVLNLFYNLSPYLKD